MYKLSEQPVSRIFDEMVNFSPLYHRVAVCKVKEPFIIGDINYEEGDLVALTGNTESEIEIEYYQNLKKRHSYDIHYGVSGDRLSITADDFKKRFELCEEETIKVENVIKQAKDIDYEKYCEIKKRRVEPNDDYSLEVISALLFCTCFTFWKILFEPSKKVSTLVLLMFVAIILVYLFHIIYKNRKYRSIYKKYSNKYLELDEQRKLEGMYIPECKE